MECFLYLQNLPVHYHSDFSRVLKCPWGFYGYNLIQISLHKKTNGLPIPIALLCMLSEHWIVKPVNRCTKINANENKWGGTFSLLHFSVEKDPYVKKHCFITKLTRSVMNGYGTRLGSFKVIINFVFR